MDYEIKNAIITHASIGDMGRGVLSVDICLDYGGCGQGFGGYALYLPKSFKHHELKSFAGHFIWRLMEVAGVSDFNSVIGKTIRVKATHSKVHGIGHIVKDDWFCPEDDFKI